MTSTTSIPTRDNLTHQWCRSASLFHWLLPFTLAVALLPIATVSAADASSTLQGRWRLTFATRNGQPAADVVGHLLRFDDGSFRITSKAGVILYQGTYTIQPDQKSPAIDFKHHRDANKGTIWLGIYRLEKNRLVVCDNAPNLKAPRPKEFKAPKGSGYIVTKFERIEE